MDELKAKAANIRAALDELEEIIAQYEAEITAEEEELAEAEDAEAEEETEPDSTTDEGAL